MADPKDDKKTRLAQALRDNLRRRKAQARDVPPDESRDRVQTPSPANTADTDDA